MFTLFRRIHYLLHRRRIQAELEEEMAAHRAMMHDASSFGSTLRLREESNDAWGAAWLERLEQDIRYSLRTLRRSPTFALTGIAVLAIGIGLNVTAFGILNTALLRPIPGIEDPHTWMRLTRSSPTSSSTNLSWPSYAFYRDNLRAFTALAAKSRADLAYTDTERWRATLVTDNFLPALGIGASRGRLARLAPGDVILSHAFFTSRFAGDPSILGKTITLNRQPARIIGITAADFSGLDPEGTDIWAFLIDHPHFFPGSQLLTSPALQPLHVYGRLAPGFTPTTAEQSTRPIVDARRQASPTEIWPSEILHVAPGAHLIGRHERMFGPLAIAFSLLMLVLLTACANLGNLLLARGVARQRELHIRAAIGATRSRLITQLMTESLTLATLGALAGLALSMFATELIVRLLAWPSWLSAAPDAKVIAFAFAAGLVSSLAFGLAPALATTRRDGKPAARLRLTLIAAQAAACCILLILSGLLLRGISHGINTSPGYSYANSILIDPDLPATAIEGAAAETWFTTLASAITRVPGVTATAFTSLPPLGQSMNTMQLPIGQSMVIRISPDYFAAMEIPLLAGRTFRPGDKDVAILGQRTASLLFPNENPIGKQYSSTDGSTRFTVIGLVGNAALYSPGDPKAMELYFPLATADYRNAYLIARTHSLTSTLEPIRKAALAHDPRVIPDVIAMRDGMSRRLRNTQSGATAVSLLGLISLTLAVVGFAGLISFAVEQRTREIGIRLALGASTANILRITLGHLATPTAVGVLTGIGLAIALGRLLESELYGLNAIDPLSLLTAPLLFLLAALLVSLAPLRRATRINPALALRHD